MTEVYEGSPIGVLSAAHGRGLEAGQVGVVTARAGVGKSALLVHVALNELLRERKVLHVAVSDTVDSARAHYDTVIRAVARSGQARDWNQALVAAERHRMIHSYMDKGFQLASLEASLKMLAEVMQFEPALIVVDGLNDTEAHLAELKGLAERLSVPIWAACRASSGQTTADAWNYASLSLRLTPDGRNVRLSMHRSSDDDQPLEVSLDSNTMLVRRGLSSDETRTVAVLSAGDCTLYSGGAKGTEATFGQAAERKGNREVNFTFEGHRQERVIGNYLLSPRELAAGDVSLVYVSRRLNRSYNAEGGVIRRVLQTLWHMVSRSQQVFVVGAIQEDGTVVGGTGWSVELARMWNKDLWVFDQDQDQWFQWSGDAWIAGEPTISSIHFCGTGTRYLKDTGKAAINALFARSFN
jgi:hypothetical protein